MAEPGAPAAAEPKGRLALEAELRASVPATVAALEDSSLEDLAQAVRAARHRQSEALELAGERALGFVPRVLRVPLRKALR
jgi:hypothetical protein